MKRTFTSSFLGLAISGLLLASCSQMASYENEDLALEQARADKAGFTLSPFGNAGGENAMVLTGEGNECITDNTNGDEYKATGNLSLTWGGGQGVNEKNLDVEVWNTLTTIEYRFVLTSTARNGDNLQYFDEEEDDWVVETSLTVGTTYSVSRPLPTGWTAGDLITEQWRTTGAGGQLGGDGEDIVENGVISFPLIGICTETTITDGTVEPICTDEIFQITASVSSYGNFTGGMIQIWDASDAVVASADVTETVKSVTYDFSNSTAGTYSFSAHYVGAGSNGYNDSKSDPITVEVEECGDCKESFSYESIDSDTYIFTYISKEDLTGAEFKFTSPHVKAITSEDDKNYSVNPGNGQGSPTVSTWIGDVIACTPITFTITFTPDCDQNEAGFANLWTDFKVNGDSKKGISEVNEIIKFECSQ